ncbi:MAG TPA: PQQ-binding-like beta-propeller repeat protein [Allosphingosinicella sp.]|nr:PQQ-binding-like beta-propeller repeat protein [Allosphingosinicella sp.]
MLRNAAVLLLAALAVAGPAGAKGKEGASLDGWWSARVEHGGESRFLYLRFANRDGRATASFSIPEIGAQESPLGRYAVGENEIKLPDAGWTLRIEDGGETLAGQLPGALVPVYPLQARFRRSAAPEAEPDPSGYQAAPAPLWRRQVEGAVYGGPAYDRRSGLLFIAADSGKVYGLRATTGALAWSVSVGSPVRSTPAVEAGALFVAADKALVKLDARSGRPLWTAPLGVERHKRLEIGDRNSLWDHYGASPVIRGKHAYVGSRDGCLYAFETTSGRQARRICTEGQITATPVVADGRLFFASFDGHVYAARLTDGAILWKRDARGAVPRDLALAGGRILAGSRSYDLLALDPESGRPEWTRYVWFSWIDSPPLVSAGKLYIGSSDSRRVFALDSASGRPLWTTRVPGWAWARPAAGATAVYAGAVGTTGRYVGRRDGALAAIDRRDGRLRWRLDVASPKGAALHGFAAAPLVAGGRLYAADLSGTVYAFKDR